MKQMFLRSLLLALAVTTGQAQGPVAGPTAAWGIDYMHLAKYDGTWKIDILWQEPPPK